VARPARLAVAGDAAQEGRKRAPDAARDAAIPTIHQTNAREISMKTLVAFHGDQNVKAKYLDRVKAHALADEIRHGFYWENGNGCAVGCTIHGADHGRYETELGIPRILARLEDRIFEGLENGDAKEFPPRFLSAIQPGADLSKVWYHFAHWLLVDPTDGVLQYARSQRSKDAIRLVAELYARAARGEKVARAEWLRARDTADAAAAAAAAAAAYAYAAAAAAYAAYAAAYAAAAAARRKAFKRQADKLIELLAAAPILQAA
jgi:hypothetical protein